MKIPIDNTGDQQTVQQQQAKSKLFMAQNTFRLNPRKKEAKAMGPSVSSAKNTPENQSWGTNSTIHMLGDLRQLTLPL